MVHLRSLDRSKYSQQPIRSHLYEPLKEFGAVVLLRRDLYGHLLTIQCVEVNYRLPPSLRTPTRSGPQASEPNKEDQAYLTIPAEHITCGRSHMWLLGNLPPT